MEKPYRFRKPKQLGKYQVQFNHIPGKWKSTGTDDFAEAVHWADEFLQRELQIGDGKITFGEFAKDFFSQSDPHGIRKRDDLFGKHHDNAVYHKKQALLDNYIIPRFGSQMMSSITSVTIEDWFLSVRQYQTRTELSADTRNKILFTMGEVFREAVRQGILLDNPAEKVRTISYQPTSERRPFTQEEMDILFPADDQQLLDIWGGLMWATFFAIEKDTGFRPGEVAALTAGNYFPEYHGIFSKDSVLASERKLKHSIKTTKVGKKYKVGLLTEQTERLLQRLINLRPEGFLFLTTHRCVIVPQVSNRHFKESASLFVELEGRTQYSLRHSFETDLAGEIDAKLVMELMAHTRYRKEYDHRTPERILEQLQPVREVLKKRGGSH